MTDPLSSCPDCGSPLPPDSPQALCPACLMRQALASRTIAPDGGIAPQLPPPSPEEIANKFPGYEILECLGRGGMGAVYKARQKSLNRIVAIKILAPERVGDGKFAERFSIEAELLAKLSHPHIVTIHDFGETGGLFYLVMEFIDGVNLRDLLRDGKLAPEQALAIVPPICDALQYAHEKGIVHRDIKPENILLDREGRVKIADFGIASLVGATGENSGTPPYMAPEQNGGTVDRRADIYALGVVLYEMLTGERPEKDIVAPSKRVEVDVRIDEMVLRALEKEPERRYQTAGEFRTVAEILGTRNAAVGSMSSLPRQPGDSGMTIPLRFEWLVIGLAALVILGAIAHFNLTFGVSKSAMLLAGVLMLVTGLVGVMFRPAHRKPDLLWKVPPLFSDAVVSVTGCIRALRKRRGWDRPASMDEASVDARLTRTPSVRMANLALVLSIAGALIPVAFLWADSAESFEHNVIRGWIVTGVTLSILIAAIGLGWSTRRLARGKAALIAASLSLLVAGVSIIAGLQRPIQFDTPIIVRSPDGSMSGMGMTLHSMRVFDSDRVTYRLLVEGANDGETWMSEVPLEQEDGLAQPLNDLSFEKRGKIDWSADGRTVSFRVGDTRIAVFDINATRWKTGGLLGDDSPEASVVQSFESELPYHSIIKMIAGAVGFLLLAAFAFFMHGRINRDRRLEKTALFLCVAGVILPLTIAIAFGMSGVSANDTVAWTGYVLFAVMQLAALILGVIRFSEPLGRAAAIASGILLLGWLSTNV